MGDKHDSEDDSLKKMSEVDRMLSKLKYISFKIGGKMDENGNNTYLIH